MSNNLREILKATPIEASAPCRIDMGGTLDISTFYYPLRHFSPCTFNIAIGLRTTVRLLPFHEGMIKISSKGFRDAEYSLKEAPFDHPLGLMFAIAGWFGAEGVHININSTSPPRSALGGSSAAAVALVSAFSKGFEQLGAPPFARKKIALLGHAIEQSVAGVPCGMQDQLAAVYGGINAWYWSGSVEEPFFSRRNIISEIEMNCKEMEQRLVLAYCGVPHESKNINGKWVQQFLSGRNRELWMEVVRLTANFVDALSSQNFKDACSLMNRETAIRLKMTPDVLDDVGMKLFDFAVKKKCGARFTGAGGGGCLWALGEPRDICDLKDIWGGILSDRKDACLLDTKVDREGLVTSIESRIYNRESKVQNQEHK